jgi:putative ABC transport system permease protein
MTLLRTLRISLLSLQRNRTRTFLTMLGVIIGVAAVISVLAIGQGARNQVQAQIASMGTNVLMVFPQFRQMSGARGEAGSALSLSESDVLAIQQQAQRISEISAVIRTGAQVIYGNQNWRTSVMGVYPSYMTIRDMQLSNGISFTDNDLRGATKVCVIGQTVATNLFGDDDPISKVIRVRSIPCRVIGVITPKGQNAMGQDQDDVILAPYSTVQKRLIGEWRPMSIQISCASQADIPFVQEQVRQILRARHKLNEGDEDNFEIRSQTDIAETADSTSKTMTILLASIAGISLLVGGIGIMNIMFVSVTERTKEIGIRLAVGAKKRDILLQFLVESVMISFLGGFLGIALGAALTQIIAKTQGWPVSISVWSIMLAFCFSTAVGIFFGWYPARKAANLKIINALRYE